MKKMLFIMNPVSGQKKAAKYLPELISLFNRADYEVIAHMTGCRGDATQVAALRGGDVDIVVC